MTRRPVVAACGVATLAAAMSMVASPGHGSSPIPGDDVHRVVVQKAADPGLLEHAGNYFIFATGGGFRVWSSSSPDGGFVAHGKSMLPEHYPEWWGERSDRAAAHLWAPHVFRIQRQPNGTRFVMFFAASREGTESDCIAIATSDNPTDGFVSRAGRKPFHCEPTGTTIDPAMYRTSRGERYLLFKWRRSGSPGRDEIRAIRLTATGLNIRRGARPFQVVGDTGPTLEAPSMVRHDGQLWLFVSRRNFANCTYFNQVWSARGIRGRFVRRGPDNGRLSIRKPGGARFCGPGGAEVLNDDGTYRIAFHAWKTWDVTSPDNVRQTWTGRLLWRPKTGVPYLAPVGTQRVGGR